MTLKRILTKTLLAGAAGMILLANAGACAQDAGAANSQQVSQLEGQNVVEVRVITESGEVLTKDIPELPLLSGHPYDAEAVRASLRKLYATGDYADLRAEVTSVTGGLRVDLVAQRNFFI